ncbi:MAG: helix-turn-helix domain-containing protein, partial [Desulfuromonadales bacterium]
VLTLELPPLRARGNDILILAQAFVDEFAERFKKGVKSIAEPAAGRLLAYPWPGNVRELRNVIERAVALARHDRLTAEDLPDRLRQPGAARSLPAGWVEDDALLPLGEMEQLYLRHVLDSVGGNRSLAAKVLGIDRKTLYRKLKGEK